MLAREKETCVPTRVWTENTGDARRSASQQEPAGFHLFYHDLSSILTPTEKIETVDSINSSCINLKTKQRCNSDQNVVK